MNPYKIRATDDRVRTCTGGEDNLLIEQVTIGCNVYRRRDNHGVVGKYSTENQRQVAQIASRGTSKVLGKRAEWLNG